MRFPDIDEEEFYLTLIFLRHRIESANLRPEWRSSVAAENQSYRAVIPKTGERNPSLLVHHLQVKIRRHVANRKLALPVANLGGLRNGRDLRTDPSHYKQREHDA